jgi:hypothetical protein
MFGAGRSAVRWQLGRLALLTIGLVPVVWIALVGLFWLQSHIPEWIYWQTGLIFLIALEIAYGATLALTVTGTVGLGFLFFRGQTRTRVRTTAARGLLLCVSLLCGLTAAEAVCAAWEHRSRRGIAVPVGGFKREAPSQPSSRFAEPVVQFNLPARFPDAQGESDIDLVVLGESSAEGVPYQRWVSIGRIIAWQLNEVLPGRTVRLNTLAKAGDTLERQHQAMANLVRRPELLIIYCGHNEFFSRLWWSSNLDHYVVDHIPTRWQVFIAQIERVSPLCNVIRETADKCRVAIPPSSNTDRHLIDVPVYTAAEFEALLLDFRRRLEEMVSYAERIGALPVLILPPANDAGFEPNRSFLPAATPRAERDTFRNAFLAARGMEDDDPGKSIERYQALLARQACFAETHYRLARVLERSGAWDLAYRHYVAARDLDGLPMRCLTPFQEAYREVASRHDCVLIDGQSYFHAIGHHGLLDNHLFQDAMHPSLRGQIALAQAVLHALHARRALGWPSDAPAPLIDPARCAAHFGIDHDSWKLLCSWDEWFNSVVIPLRYDSSRRLQARDAGVAAANKIAAGAAPETVGLPNVGIPAPVQVVPLSDISPSRASVPIPESAPCLRTTPAS